MSRYVKKTDRPRAYSPLVIWMAVECARRTSINQAARESGISTHCIGRHLRLAGHTPRPRGNPPLWEKRRAA